jgi:hypothetical protein
MLACGRSAMAGPQEEAYLEGVRRDLAEVDAALAGMEQFVRGQNAQMEVAKPVAALDREALERVQVLLDGAGVVSRQDDNPWWELKTRFDWVKSADARLRSALTLETHMRPDAYAGEDAAELKAMAEKTVASAEPDVQVLKTVLVSSAWVQGETAQWEDGEHKTLTRHPVRRLVAEVAGRINANTKLYIVGFRQESGAPLAEVWSQVPMLEEHAE